MVTPDRLRHDMTVNPDQLYFVSESQQTLRNIIHGQDKRLAVIVGPCSIHDVKAAREYAQCLHEQQDNLGDDLFLVMRSYFEKPRTSLGWKGFLNDPHLDGSCDIESGLRLARQLLLDLASLKIPAGGELLNPLLQQALSDLVSWYAIGARTTESPLHREIVSGLAIPTGFKNTREGSIQAAVDAVCAAGSAQTYYGMDASGRPAIITTQGNPFCHIILRGSLEKTNYDIISRLQAKIKLKEAGLEPRLMIDCSHGNSPDNFHVQIDVANILAKHIAGGDQSICGMMIESHLAAGRQRPETRPLTYGQSITDACIAWEDTVPLLEQLALSVLKRRQAIRQSA